MSRASTAFSSMATVPTPTIGRVSSCTARWPWYLCLSSCRLLALEFKHSLSSSSSSSSSSSPPSDNLTALVSSMTSSRSLSSHLGSPSTLVSSSSPLSRQVAPSSTPSKTVRLFADFRRDVERREVVLLLSHCPLQPDLLCFLDLELLHRNARQVSSQVP